MDFSLREWAERQRTGDAPRGIGNDALGLTEASVTDRTAEVCQGFGPRRIVAQRQSFADAGIRKLAVHRGLRRLNLKATGVSDTGVKELAAGLPQCKIE